MPGGGGGGGALGGCPGLPCSLHMAPRRPEESTVPERDAAPAPWMGPGAGGQRGGGGGPRPPKTECALDCSLLLLQT